MVLWGKRDIVTIMETWWGNCHGWSGVVMVIRGMQRRRGGGVTLYIREYFSCVALKDSDDKAECL